MLRLGQDAALLGLADVVQPQPQMIFRRHLRRPHHVGLIADQRHDVACADVRDGSMQAGERADVNHCSVIT